MVSIGRDKLYDLMRSGHLRSVKDGTAITWSAGVNVAPIGFDASAQTGYSANAHVKYKFGANRHVCGTNGTRAVRRRMW